MDGQKDATDSEEREKPFPWRGFVLWPLVMVVIYFLSFGPVAKIERVFKDPGVFDQMVEVIYGPWLWTYDRTPLHKPLGKYMHLWLPRDFDEHGEIDLQMSFPKPGASRAGEIIRK